MCGVPFFMWQTANTLAAACMPALSEIWDETVFPLHYLIAGLGLVATGFACDRIRSARTRWLLAAALAATTGILTVSLIFVSGIPSYLVFFFAATFSGFGTHAVLLGGLFARIPQACKPLAFGLAFATAVSLRIPIDLYAAKDRAGAYTGYLLFAGVAFFLLTAALFTKPVRQRFTERDHDATTQEPMDIGKSGRLVWITAACGVVVYIQFGILDNLFSWTPLFQNSVIYFRLAQIVSSIAVGLICLRFGYYAAIISSISFLGAGTLAPLFSWIGVAGLLCVVVTVIGFQLFTIPLRSIFAEVGKRGKYPHTVAAFGFGLYFITQIIGIPIAGQMRGMDRESGMALYALLFVAMIPIIMLLFYALKNSHRTACPDQPDMWEKYNLSRREREILGFVLKGMLSREIAELIFVSEATVNWHVSNILKKTGAANRAKLIQMNGAEE